MLAEVISSPLETTKGNLEPGSKVRLSESKTMQLQLWGRIRIIDPVKEPFHFARIEDGELKLLYPTKDLASIIVGLTKNDLPLQKQLLRMHCQRYDPVTHFPDLKEMWEEKAAILEYCAGLPREEAEMEAAKMYHLETFMDELRVE